MLEVRSRRPIRGGFFNLHGWSYINSYAQLDTYGYFDEKTGSQSGRLLAC